MLLKRASSLGRLRQSSASKDTKKTLVRVPSTNKFPKDFFTPPLSKKRTGSACQLQTRSSIHVPQNALDFTFMCPITPAKSSIHSTVVQRKGFLFPKKRGCFLKLEKKLHIGRFGQELHIRS